MYDCVCMLCKSDEYTCLAGFFPTLVVDAAVIYNELLRDGGVEYDAHLFHVEVNLTFASI